MLQWGTENVSLRHIWYEVAEVLAVLDKPDELGEELRDTVLVTLLYAAQRGIPIYFPSKWTSLEKLKNRVIDAQFILEQHNLMDYTRHHEDPYYWRRYMVHGTNLTKRYKLRHFLEAARNDYRRPRHDY